VLEVLGNGSLQLETEKLERLIWQSETLLRNDNEAVEDLLGRRDFSRFLAKEVSYLWQRTYQENSSSNKSLIFNVYGSWGAGKSTFVNMLIRELKNEQV